MKSLTDVVSGAGLSGYAEIALVIFLVAFIGIVFSLFAPSKQRTYEHLRHLPVDGEPAPVRLPLYPDDGDSSTRASRSLGMTNQGDSSLRSE